MGRRGIDKDFAKQVGLNIKYWRKARKLTYAELAEKIDSSDQMIFYYESGNNLPILDRFVAICKALYITPNDLLPWYSQYSWTQRQKVKNSEKK